MSTDKILILDFGSQYTQLIARRIREMHVYCEIHPCTLPLKEVQQFGAKAIILSGGPDSVLDKKSPKLHPEILQMGIPVLGICYGMQAITQVLGGKVEAAAHREYGKAYLKDTKSTVLFNHLKTWPMQVWMSHGDRIAKVPPGFDVIAISGNSPCAAFANASSTIFGLQFHPEVVHTLEGKKILKAFLFDVAKCEANWNMHSFIETQIEVLRKQIGKENVICGLSGGVDSSVAAVLLHKAIGDQLTCIFVDNGFLRKDERHYVEKIFRDNFHIQLDVVDASDRFLKKIKGISDPEEKRKKAGNLFIEIFEEEAKRVGNAKFLAQGTLYPDVIESVSFKGPSATIKTHHNVGGLPEKMHLKLVEPFRELFKDEVRAVGEELKLPAEMIHRHPFPGPGLLIRVLGEVTKEKLDILREADAIFMEELKNSGWYEKTWQAFCVFLPVKAVGVMGDERTYENVIALRAVNSTDAMTADWSHLPYNLLGTVSNRIINEVKGVNRVVYDISSKPPGTIEWE
ncbi:MAG: glutamine-hydrolyzing GMP synthase [Deltaproteobacteria bacterium CG_4_10_14_0_2_um_filter_43_8]|nr:MAG: glutamine-hydrolyzing GMP synthase [Deltaproteobacteria bacterium CG11_big_fil_rev_8_21_14_0_20_42_23]PJA19781.1 MAG: glutamine-hydrolyzing GMP synthase [Deltaproteobacteria bacterium CG_4_10_14_0_2_um_filter_43_8]PJC64661.1 MAG: glutamine-hydrolyzing GMP synthase [Deltaproteobacteria bacterium CG_4_9_14_0_2_um_filter_42_21]